MKLLDPFAGYKLAIGHPLFHMALFGASWTVKGTTSTATDDTMHSDFRTAFEMLKWAHLIVVLLLLPKICANKKDVKKMEKMA